jgi:hypothetical protein
MKKGLFSLLLALSLLFGGAAAAINGSSSSIGVHAEASSSSENDPAAPITDGSSDEHDFSAEELVSGTDLSVSLTSSSLTDSSQSFSCAMSSVQIEAFNNGSSLSNVFVRIDDENYADLKTAKDEAEQAKTKAEEEGKEFEPTVYNGTVYNISNAKKDTVIVLPQTISYGSWFKIDVTGIDSNACYDEKNSEISYKDITEIVIPEGYTSIAGNAFPEAKDNGVIIRTSYPSIQEGWDEEFTDAEVEYGYVISAEDSKTSRKLAAKCSGTTKFGEGKDFIIGYYDKKSPYYAPLIITYDTLNDLDDSLARSSLEHVCSLGSSNRVYDAVGSHLGSNSYSFNIDLVVDPGTHVDPESLIFHNIYEVAYDIETVEEIKDGKTTVTEIRTPRPDFEKPAYCARPRISFTSERYFKDFVTISPTKISSFGGYTMVAVKAELDHSVFQKVNPSSYRNHKSEIESGDVRVRILLASLSSSSYQIVYKSGGELKKVSSSIVTPLSTSEIASGEELGFLFKDSDIASDYSSSGLVSIQIAGLCLKVDLYNNQKDYITNSSSVATRFAYVDLLTKEQSEGITRVSVGAYLGIAYGVYAILFIGAAIGYYYYAKNKYKNDEFRRMDGKRYIKKCGRNFLVFGLILSAILFIVARWGMLDNVVVVYNPLDVWVIVFAIAGAISLGLVIRDLVIYIKRVKETKKKLKLGLNKDVVEDGTK